MAEYSAAKKNKFRSARDLEDDVNNVVNRLRDDGWSDKTLRQARAFLQPHIRLQTTWKAKSPANLIIIKHEKERLKETWPILSIPTGNTCYNIEIYPSEANIGSLCAANIVWDGIPQVLKNAYNERGQASLIHRVLARTDLGSYRTDGVPNAEPTSCPTKMYMRSGPYIQAARLETDTRREWESGFELGTHDQLPEVWAVVAKYTRRSSRPQYILMEDLPIEDRSSKREASEVASVDEQARNESGIPSVETDETMVLDEVPDDGDQPYTLTEFLEDTDEQMRVRHWGSEPEDGFLDALAGVFWYKGQKANFHCDHPDLPDITTRLPWLDWARDEQGYRDAFKKAENHEVALLSRLRRTDYDEIKIHLLISNRKNKQVSEEELDWFSSRCNIKFYSQTYMNPPLVHTPQDRERLQRLLESRDARSYNNNADSPNDNNNLDGAAMSHHSNNNALNDSDLTALQFDVQRFKLEAVKYLKSLGRGPPAPENSWEEAHRIGFQNGRAHAKNEMALQLQKFAELSLTNKLPVIDKHELLALYWTTFDESYCRAYDEASRELSKPSDMDSTAKSSK